MRRRLSITMLIVTLTLCGVAAATAASSSRRHRPSRDTAANLEIPRPNSPRIQAPAITAPTVDAPNVPKPLDPSLNLTAAQCATVGCDPQRFAGTVVAFDGRVLTVQTDAGRTYRALVTTQTNIACPPAETIAAGRVFNPVPPTRPHLGSRPEAPSSIQLRDRYACSPSEVSAGRRIAGAAICHNRAGALRWVAIAIAPS
jgi:hypothetical protein